ncbi:hypothetical protein NPA07_01160 [Mycoplasmopsis caviae]|uniref:Uncharacterized protein n=1 Tax=Mycoplasmopsis caviae TaxID=55603 RepID=A0A3P8KWG9_9BACT|nr:hypothetical protein [Mycoplasmopsis caviae]UUD35466.1 hypothetical protein NPA07_01160 [Mycoplasmopsis caviae]VDR41757.1 Uncharacterised protein [Mycoplasmopsis caviae]
MRRILLPKTYTQEEWDAYNREEAKRIAKRDFFRQQYIKGADARLDKQLDIAIIKVDKFEHLFK